MPASSLHRHREEAVVRHAFHFHHREDAEGEGLGLHALAGRGDAVDRGFLAGGWTCASAPSSWMARPKISKRCWDSFSAPISSSICVRSTIWSWVATCMGTSGFYDARSLQRTPA